MTVILGLSAFLLKALVFIFVIGVLVLVHEFGHFIVAKWCGVGVLKFAVGFGPALVRWRRGETIYQIGAIPLGGFVRMIGDIPDMITGPQETDSAVRDGEPVSEDQQLARELFADRSRWFIEKSLPAKSAIVAAGPIFNFIFAFFVATLCGLLYGEESLVDGPVIGDVIKNSPGEAAGLKSGDEVYRIDGVAIKRWKELAESIHQSNGKTLVLDVKRGDVELKLQAVPQARPITQAGQASKMYFLGLSPSTKHDTLSLGQSFKYGWLWTYEKTVITYLGLWEMLAGRASTKDLAGPIFIFQEAGRQVARGFESLLYFMAIISVSLAVLNLLPIPVLDGGHLFFFLLEALIGPISIRKKEVAQQLGMLLLLCLMAFAIRNDVVRPSHQEPDWKEIIGHDAAKEAAQKTSGTDASAPLGSPAPADGTAVPK